jgi:hypothetical protein
MSSVAAKVATVPAFLAPKKTTRASRPSNQLEIFEAVSAVQRDLREIWCLQLWNYCSARLIPLIQLKWQLSISNYLSSN